MHQHTAYEIIQKICDFDLKLVDHSPHSPNFDHLQPTSWSEILL